MSQAPGRLHLILCEGFDDRSFWSGWLLHLGCSDPTDGGQRKIPDPYGRPVVGKGKFHFHTQAKSSIVVRPTEGRANLRRHFDEVLEDHKRHPHSRLVLNLDSDAEDDRSSGARDAVRQIAASHGVLVGDPCREPFEIDGMTIVTVIWECPNDSEVEGVPRKQTLERLVAASIQAAYPGRGESVERWLADEPPGGSSHKNYGLSYLAKWYADHGADDFYRALWRDERVAAELRSRLEASGAWAVVEELVAD